LSYHRPARDSNQGEAGNPSLRDEPTIPRSTACTQARQQTYRSDDRMMDLIKATEVEHGTDTLLISLNCNGVATTIEELARFVTQISAIRKPAALLIQETKYQTSKMNRIRLEGYSAARTTQNKNNGKRGSMIFLANNHNAENSPDRREDGIELIGINLIGSNVHTYDRSVELWSLYCPPDPTSAKNL